MNEATADGRHLRSGKRTPFTRPPRNRSRRPSNHARSPLGIARTGEGGDRDARGSLRSLAAEDNAAASESRSCRSGCARRETRTPPGLVRIGRPRASRCAVVSQVGILRESYGREERGAFRHARTSTRREPRYESGSPARSPMRHRTDSRLAALGSDDARVFSWMVSECRSRSDASPDRDARGRLQAPTEHARSSSKEVAHGATTGAAASDGE
jgi:hypothetical protein